MKRTSKRMRIEKLLINAMTMLKFNNIILMGIYNTQRSFATLKEL